MSPFTNFALGMSLTFSIFPLDRLSYIVTSVVSSESLLHRWKPMKPAPPVTSIRFSLSWAMKSHDKVYILFVSEYGICRR